MVNNMETGGELYTRLGINGRLWAEEMHKRFGIAIDDLLPWTCGMCMAGYDKGCATKSIDKTTLLERMQNAFVARYKQEHYKNPKEAHYFAIESVLESVFPYLSISEAEGK